MLVFMERRERCICLAYFLIKEQGMQQSQPVLVLCFIFWLAFEGLLHERKLLLHPPSSFGSPAEQVLLLPTPINSATVIHHMFPFSGDTTPSTSIFALAVCWSLNSNHFFLLAPFHNNNDKKK